MNIVFMGSPDFAVPVLTRLVEDGHQIAAVYTQPDKPAGRGQTLHISPVKSYALSRGFIIKQPLTLKDTAVQEELKALAPDIMRCVKENPPPPPLTEKQKAILASVTRGLSNQDIALEFGISPVSVKKHLSVIFAKLGVATRAEAASVALQKHLLKT